MKKILVLLAISFACIAQTTENWVAWHFNKKGVLFYKDTLTLFGEGDYTYSFITDDSVVYYSYMKKKVFKKSFQSNIEVHSFYR